MKLPDNEPLEADDYWTVTDTWKQEWEKGVQVRNQDIGIQDSVLFRVSCRCLSSQMVSPSPMSVLSYHPTRVKDSLFQRS